MEAFERFDHAGFVCELHMDEDPRSPADWDTLGTLVGFSDLTRGWEFTERNATWQEEEALERGGFRLVARYLRLTAGAIAVPFEFRDYGSSGNRLLATSEDDSHVNGFLVTTPARVAELASEEQSRDPEWIEEALRGELREWGAWAAQEVVGYVVRYDDDAERFVNERVGDLPAHARHGSPDRDPLIIQLGHEVYIAKECLVDEASRAALEALSADGFVPLVEGALEDGARYIVRFGTLYVGQSVPVYGKEREVRVRREGGRLFLMPKGARTRGFVVSGPALVREVPS